MHLVKVCTYDNERANETRKCLDYPHDLYIKFVRTSSCSEEDCVLDCVATITTGSSSSVSISVSDLHENQDKSKIFNTLAEAQEMSHHISPVQARVQT